MPRRAGSAGCGGPRRPRSTPRPAGTSSAPRFGPPSRVLTIVSRDQHASGNPNAQSAGGRRPPGASTAIVGSDGWSREGAATSSDGRAARGGRWPVQRCCRLGAAGATGVGRATTGPTVAAGVRRRETTGATGDRSVNPCPRRGRCRTKRRRPARGATRLPGPRGSVTAPASTAHSTLRVLQARIVAAASSSRAGPATTVTSMPAAARPSRRPGRPSRSSSGPGAPGATTLRFSRWVGTRLSCSEPFSRPALEATSRSGSETASSGPGPVDEPLLARVGAHEGDAQPHAGQPDGEVRRHAVLDLAGRAR